MTASTATCSTSPYVMASYYFFEEAVCTRRTEYPPLIYSSATSSST
jgi:hypothetical protein